MANERNVRPSSFPQAHAGAHAEGLKFFKRRTKFNAMDIIGLAGANSKISFARWKVNYAGLARWAAFRCRKAPNQV